MENLAQITWHYEDGIKITDEPIGSAELGCPDQPTDSAVRNAVKAFGVELGRASKILRVRTEYNSFKGLWTIHAWKLEPSLSKSRKPF